jgi:predicted DsbA family dithiol-disulfide isomerase
MRIDVFSDAVCPWCWLGKRRFERALGAQADLVAEVHYRPFELNPDLPPEGMPRAEYLERRFGDVNRFAAAQRDLAALGAAEGIAFEFGAIRRMPNTRRAHALIALAAGQGRGAQAAERVFRAYFAEGADIADPDVLASLGTELGLDAAAVRAGIDEPTLHAEIAAAESQAQAAGISGVPAFVFDGRYLVSGAQDPATFARVFEAVRTA